MYTDYLSQVKNEEFPSAQSYEATTQGTERQEILAQSICTSIAGPNQWVFAVQRDCRTQDSCEAICTSAKLRVQAPQQRIKEREWRATLALHIYPNRPKSQPGNAHNPHLGFWVYRYANVNAPTGYCGPNYCCCSVAFSGPV